MENKVVLIVVVLLVFFGGTIFADSFTGNAFFDKFFSIFKNRRDISIREICDDKRDNDRDRRIDCQDLDCSKFCQLEKIRRVRDIRSNINLTNI